MTRPARILRLSGSPRPGSTNTSLLRPATTPGPGYGPVAALFTGLADLPPYNPADDHDPLPPAVTALRTQIEAADALVFCTPEYAGALPGSFKNLLDWTVGGAEIYGKPVAWINVSSIAAPTGGADAHASLAKVLGYVGADIVEAACGTGADDPHRGRTRGNRHRPAGPPAARVRPAHPPRLCRRVEGGQGTMPGSPGAS